MEIKLFNTLGKKLKEFKPIKSGEVKMYHCGPTVYNFVHIGNVRAFYLADMLKRTFEYAGYTVDQIMNITDVDDKTIRRSKEENVSLTELTRKYEQAFFGDLKSLNINIKKTVRATDSIDEMIGLIENLIKNEVAYVAEDGVYFSISKSNNYGELVGLSKSENNTIERIKNDEYDKENPQDFALWKFHTESDGEVAWDASFGRGRPGWHIECSAMAMASLGETIDIHTGGIDLAFPHHTNEIAQSESATGNKFVNYWLHNNFITIDNHKVSKSLKNDIYLSEIIKRGINPLAYRYWLLTSHYQSLANFTWDALGASSTAYNKLVKLVAQNPEVVAGQSAISDSIVASICNNLDTPQALSKIWESKNVGAILEVDKILGLDLENQAKKVLEIHIDISEEIQHLLGERKIAKDQKDFTKSDQIRDQIKALGFDVKDTENGTTLSPLSPQ